MLPSDRDNTKRAQHTFDVEWLPDVDPTIYGTKGLKTCQNMRPYEKTLQGVEGCSKINTTAISNYTKIRAGHQLRSDKTLKSYIVVQAEHDSAPSSNENQVYSNETTIPNQGDFNATQEYTDASVSLRGRFSDGPTGLTYCNGEESCNWDGDEMRVAAFYTVSEVTDTRDDYTFNNGAKTCATAAGDFLERGFKAGQTVTVTNGGNDGLSYTISSINEDGDTLTFSTAPVNETLGTSQTIYVDSDEEYTDPIDYTDAVNNELQTAGNTVDTYGGNDSYTKLLVHANTSISDASNEEHSITANGDAAISNDAAKWGTGSVKFDGDGDSLSVADSTDWNFGTGEVCLDAQVNFDSVDQLHTIFYQEDGAGDYDHVWLFFDGLRDKIYFHVVSASGTVDIHEEGSWSPSVSTWYHVAVIRGWDGNANDWAITVDGTAVATFTASVTMPDLSSALYIGGGADQATLDYSGEDHPIRADGTAVVSSTHKWGTGGIVFDGNSDLLTILDSTDWDIVGSNDAGSYTIDFWAKHDDHAGTEGYYMQYTNTDTYIRLFHNDGDGLRFDAYDSGVAIINTGYGGEITDTDWHHIAVVIVADGVTKDIGVYLDGTQVSHTQDDSTRTYSGYVVIGEVYAGGNQYFDGSIDEFRITHSNPFSAVPVAGLTDTITVPTSAHTPDANTKLLLHFDTTDFDGYMDEIRVSKGTSRWSSNFTAPDRAYKEAQTRWYVFSTRPLKGAKFYIANANTEASSLAGRVWTGRGFSDLTLTDGTLNGGGTISMYQTGTVSFASTVSSASPWHFEGLYLYAYEFEISAGGAEIYHVSLDSPFQEINDIWDGVYRQPIQFQKYDTSATKYIDYTLEVNEESYTDTPIGAVLDQLATGDHLLVAFENRVSAIHYSMLAGLTNSNTASPTVYYWSGRRWVTVGTVHDSTAHETGLKSLSQTGLWYWHPPADSDEAERTLFGTTGYFYKIVFSAELSGTDGGDEDIVVDVVTGIPAQYTIAPFEFPSLFKNRVLLCGYEEGHDGNRVDYAVPNAPNVFNGEDSSMDSIQSLYFGADNQKLTSGVQLYNRFGSNIFATWLSHKQNETYLLTGDGPEDYKIYPISFTVGNPAPYTLDSAEMGFELTKDVNRNIAMWVSYSGPVIFDGAVMQYMRGVFKYFDPTDSEYINTSYLWKAKGCYDPTYKEYHMLLPTGSSTEINKWIVYSLYYKRFYEVVPSSYPISMFRVMDTNGIQYVYAGFSDGYMRRIWNGPDWDGNALTYVWETGDFAPAENNVWFETKLNYIKTLMKTTAEDLDLDIVHIPDTYDSVPSYTRTDISFTATDTIETTAGDFRANFHEGQIVTLSGSTSNNKEFTIETISDDGKTLTVSGNAITTEAAGDTVTVTVTADLRVALDSGSNRLVINTDRFNRESTFHRLRFSVSAGTGANASAKAIQAILWGYEYDAKRKAT